MPAGDWASYYWPGTTVLRNKLGIHDRDELRIQEHAFVSTRQADLELGTAAIAATYDEQHLRNIHRHLFQDVYDWAGEFRTVPLAKPPLSVFADPNRIIDCLNHAAAINDTIQWAALPADEFADAMASIYAWANQAHPFREATAEPPRSGWPRSPRSHHGNWTTSASTPTSGTKPRRCPDRTAGSSYPIPAP